jgi:hypothetical protein
VSGPARVLFEGEWLQIPSSQIAILAKTTFTGQPGDTFSYAGIQWEVQTISVPSDHDDSILALAGRE